MNTHQLQLGMPLPIPMDASRAAGVVGATLATEKAEGICPNFAERAYVFVLDYIAEHGPISGELVTVACVAAGIDPGERRAFGSIYARALREGEIRAVAECRRMFGHGTAGGRIYARCA
ncbi:hypothetical protein GT347_20175 [Xylophilus rhododendri]|uniref:Uncharacterized protein n=1 Tax=Xylophilus rhododendri TaxID=2697032 RepID=A0A857JAT7_9BURK|nr:hypothetical protein [Xylophilus rhododendri]QHJ00093.1 hypothetical protein GT347_20175 [Xylophilus rhododendri]